MNHPTPPRPAAGRAVTPALAAALTVAAAAAAAQGPSPPSPTATAPASKPVDPAINAPFRDPDPKEFVAKFESESREVYTHRGAIVDALGVKPGTAVADLGAGTGLFTRLLAEKVGPGGKVFAVDIAPAFLDHVRRESARLGQSQVLTVLGTQSSVNLPEASVDLAFACDAYHHFEQPTTLLASLRKAVKPGGLLVLIDFDRVPGRSSEFTLKHVRAGKDVFVSEVRAAGFEPIESPDPLGLKENFFLRFRRLDAVPPPAPPPPRGPFLSPNKRKGGD